MFSETIVPQTETPVGVNINTLDPATEFDPCTQLPALCVARRNGDNYYLAKIDRISDYNGFLFARVTFADGQRLCTNLSNVRRIPTVTRLSDLAHPVTIEVK